MKAEYYEAWKQSHQINPYDIDIADAVINQITCRAGNSRILSRVEDVCLLNWIQAKVCIRTCILILGALLGALRLLVQVYSVLFA